METLINRDKPLLMHIDLNSCFASIEQQANPLLRGKPVVVAAYGTPNAFILAPSIEAKAIGIKMGMRVSDAQAISSGVIVRTPDPPKYRDVHQRFMRIFQSYTPEVTAKSIDEAILDFRDAYHLRPDLVGIAQEIKSRMKTEIGEWIRCSIGISTNMFLAKLGATLHKPDGLTVIDHTNLLETYKGATLLDFCGINVRYQARLNAHGILTPLDFFHASGQKLHKDVFRSIVGSRWFEKLRGYEGLVAHGVHMWFHYRDYTSWHRGQLMHTELYTTLDLYRHAMKIFDAQPEIKKVSQLGVSCYGLSDYDSRQLMIFEEDSAKARKVADAADVLNDKYGEFTVVPGTMARMDSLIIDRIAFGGVRDMEFLV